MKSALVVIDMQRDFMPGGALSVPDADLLIPKINRLMHLFPMTIASQDFHPKNHVSFASTHPGRKIGDSIQVGKVKQILWPEHCVQDTLGSDFDPRLDVKSIHKIIPKGTHQEIDSYSAFFDNAQSASTGLAEYLKSEGINRVFICGVATEYCVLFSVLDALRLGFSVFVIEDACKGIELAIGDEEKAFAIMKQKGAGLISSSQVPAFL